MYSMEDGRIKLYRWRSLSALKDLRMGDEEENLLKTSVFLIQVHNPPLRPPSPIPLILSVILNIVD